MSSSLKKLLVGTKNQHKLKEISDLLASLPFEILSLNDFPNIAPVVEDGVTLQENAIKKASAYAKVAGLLTLADDTGLEVAALNGAPGVLSARYAGEKCSYEDNNRKLLQNLALLKNGNRKARFLCVIAIADPINNFLETAKGSIDGEILPELRGGNGFGYDPIFYIPELNKTLAELSLDEKNRISHRAQAAEKAREILLEHIKGEKIAQ